MASEYPGSRYVVFRQTYLDLCKTTRRTFEKTVPSGWVVRDVKDETEFRNGSEIQWLHLDTADEKTLRGLEINGAFGDQIEEIHPELMDVIDSRLGRWQLPKWPQRCPAYLWSTSNPKGHDAVYYRYDPAVIKYDRIDTFTEWDATQIAKAQEMGMNVGDPKQIPPSVAAYSSSKSYFFGSSLINLPKLNEIDPTYVKNLLNKSESWKKVWVYGSRDFFEGSIHAGFKEAIHVYNPTRFDPTVHSAGIRLSLAGFDYGLSAPTAYLTSIVDREGFVYITDEYHAANKGIEQHAGEIKKCMSRRMPEAILADPTVFHEDTRDRKVMTRSIAQEYAQYGIGFIRADNNEDTSIEKIEELLHVDPSRMNPVTKQQGSPLLFISSTCKNLINEIAQQRRKEQRNVLTGEKEFLDERDDTVPDHSYDCLSGDTLVDTLHGQKRIADLVGTEGLVWAPTGWIPYKDCRKYRVDSKCVQVDFADGRSVVSTHDHLFLTPNGWTRAEDLAGHTVCDILSVWNKSSYSTVGSKNSAANATGYADNIFSVMESGCTAPYGSITTAPFPTDTTYTIETEIGLTTKSPTSNASLVWSISACTPKASLTRKLSKLPKKLRRLGMAAVWALNGIAGTTNSIWRSLTSVMLSASASNATASLSRLAVAGGGLVSVPMRVNLRGDTSRASTTRSGRAPVVPSFLSTDMCSSGFAPPNAVTVSGVKPAPSQDTYCLTVEHPCHAFSVNDGLVVHNCLRYITNSKYLDYAPWAGNIPTPSYANSPASRKPPQPREKDVVVGARS